MQLEPCTALNASASTAIVSRPALFVGVVLVPGTAASTLTVYDNTAGSGTVIASLSGVANGAAIPLILNIPVMCTKGIYVAVAGTGATFTAYYSQSN